MKPTDILNPDQRKPSKAYLVNAMRKAVYGWREQGYPGATPTTKRLFQFWFEEDHITLNKPFSYWFCQREAIETLVYLYEVMKKRNFIDTAREFGSGPIQGYDPSYDQYPLYAFKMATGAGKTYVMALNIVWHYFNYHYENKDEYASKFLLIAGEKNVIYDRLTKDYKHGKIFRDLPLIPPEWQSDFNLKVIVKEDPIHVIPDDVLFVTNIQQLEPRKNRKAEMGGYVDKVMELPEAYNVNDVYQENRIKQVLTSCPDIMIMKDEAHHIYNFEKAWKQILLGLHKELKNKYGAGIIMELDFSATPKTETGALFPWVISDFSLKEAIESDITKRPVKGRIENAKEIASKKAVERYRAWIEAGIRRWREYKKKLKLLGTKPVLFVQCPENEEADEVFGYINSIPDLKGKVLLIHTDSTGEVTKADLPEAREFARTVDEPDPEKNPYEAIVSTMMLNEGWDVRNVNVIVGLRPYGSKRKVLPEQVIGRGLRKMFPDEEASADPEKSVVNVLEVIGPPGLTEILDELESEEGIKFADFDPGKPINLTTIYVDENKTDKDIEIPILSPRIIIREFPIDEKAIREMLSLSIPLENKILETEYIGQDMLTGRVVIKRKWDLPVPQDSKSVIAYYADRILKQLKTGGPFASFYPLVKQYVEEKLFSERVDLDDPRVLYKLSSTEVQEQLINIFVQFFKNIVYTEREPDRSDTIKLSDTPPFIWSKSVWSAEKCIFNYIPCDNDLEINFAKFLERADDVIAFSKIVPKIDFFIEYRDTEGNLRYYYPDFIISTRHNDFIIIETKGREDVDVVHKDKRIQIWCEDAINITNSKWTFIRVNQDFFEKYRFKNIAELLTTVK